MSEDQYDPEKDSQAGGEEDSPDGPSGTEEKLEQRFRETQQAYHQSREEIAELKGQLQAFTQQQLQSQTPVEPPKPLIETLTEDQLEEYRNDPTRIIALVEDVVAGKVDGLRSAVATAISERDQRFEQFAVELDPDVRDNREAIDKLREDPDFSGLSDKQALKVLSLSQVEDSSPAPRGGASSSQSVRPTRSMGETLDVKKDPALSNILEQMHPGISQRNK